jgi:hypothetical protein
MRTVLCASLVSVTIGLTAAPLAQTATPGQAPAAGTPGAPAARGRGTPPPPVEKPPAVLPAPARPYVSMAAPTPDPRVGLKAGRWDAAQAAWNLRVVSSTPPQERSIDAWHSDLAFSGNYAIQGNYNGFEIYDISNPARPVLANAYICPASQNDVSVYRNLLFMSAEATNSRADCGFGGVPEPVSKDRVRGIRIFDITNVAAPKLITSVQTCRGSHTHTVVTDPKDKAHVYVYVSGSAGVRPAEELSGCSSGTVAENPNTAQFRIEVIQVPLAAPEKSRIVSSPRIFEGLAPPPQNPARDAAAGGRAGGGGGRGGRGGAANPSLGPTTPQAGGPPVPPPAAADGRGGRGGGQAAAAATSGAPGGNRGGGRGGGAPTGPNQCHDITVYPAIGLAGGACAGYGLLLDIRDPARPVRLDQAADANMAYWHSATFSNDGTKVLFTDEWGGGTAPRCRDTDRPEWGANALFTIEKRRMVFHGYYKLPAAQTSQENCVAHNGSLIPIPGRDVMVQAWYQGGLSIFDWTDVKQPKEIAYFDRGPVDATRLVTAGSWSAYYYNGVIVSSEIARGLDIFELVPSGLISQNEIDAAKTVTLAYLNAQEQPKYVWPPSFPLVRSYLDQLERSKGLEASAIAAARSALVRAENLTGSSRRIAITRLAATVSTAGAQSTDDAKVRTLAAALRALASATE